MTIFFEGCHWPCAVWKMGTVLMIVWSWSLSVFTATVKERQDCSPCLTDEESKKVNSLAQRHTAGR